MTTCALSLSLALSLSDRTRSTSARSRYTTARRHILSGRRRRQRVDDLLEFTQYTRRIEPKHSRREDV